MRREKYYLVALSASIWMQPISAIQAADCVEKACVDVYTQNGELIIEGRKGSGPKAKTVPKPVAPKPVAPKPVVPKKPVMPKPVVPKSVAPIPQVPKPPIVKKPVVTKSPTPKAVIKKEEVLQEPPLSLSDRLSKSVPTGGVSYQPNFQPLVNVPVFFWADLPSVYRTEVKIIGETIDVVLRPAFTWSFGDGTFRTTTDPGGPYPDGKISHSFSRPGTYIVTLITSWNGSFTHNSAERAITGSIKKTSIVTIKVVAAPTRFMN